jgi:hypothetical protein
MFGVRSLLASCVQPGDRVLYAGPFAKRFFDRSAHCRPTSRATATLHDVHLAGERFDVIVARGAVETLSDEALQRWAYRVHRLLKPGGRLALAIRPLNFDPSMWAFDVNALGETVDLRRLADPWSALDVVVGEGFAIRNRLHRWSSVYEVCVFEPINKPVYAFD